MVAKKEKQDKNSLSFRFWFLVISLGLLLLVYLTFLGMGFPSPIPASMTGDYEYEAGDEVILMTVGHEPKEVVIGEAHAQEIYDDLGLVFQKFASGSDIAAEICFIRNGIEQLKIKVLYDGTIMRGKSLYKGPYSLRTLVRKHYNQ